MLTLEQIPTIFYLSLIFSQNEITDSIKEACGFFEMTDLFEQTSYTDGQPILRFYEGTLVLEGWEENKNPPLFEWDQGRKKWHALAIHYREIIETFSLNSQQFMDEASQFEPCNFAWKLEFESYPYRDC